MIHKRRRSRRGAMLVLVAVVLVLLLVGVVFSIDMAYMHVVRAELRTATDAAARAGSGVLARQQDTAAARAAAVDIAQRNQVAGEGLTLGVDDIQLGMASENVGGRFTFVPNQLPLTAVRVVGRREQGSPDGPVNLFFARFFSAKIFEPVESAAAAAKVRDVALVLDVSGSMSSPSGGGTRLTALQAAVDIFLSEVALTSPHARISLTSYSTAPEKLIDLTEDFESIRQKVAEFEADGYTAIGDALTVGSDSLINDTGRREFADKTLIVMTDGNHNTGPSPDITVQTAIDREQQVHTVTFSSGANQSLMQSVAHATEGGMHLHADDADDLAAVFREIARSLSVVLVE